MSVEGGWPQFGVGSEILAQIMEGEGSFFFFLFFSLFFSFLFFLNWHFLTSGLLALFWSELGFDHLDAPAVRVTGADIPTPYAVNLEKLAFPEPQIVVDTVRRLLK